MLKVYKVFCEWDIGLEDVVFASKSKAFEAIDKAFIHNMDFTYEEALEQNLVGVKSLTFIE